MTMLPHLKISNPQGLKSATIRLSKDGHAVEVTYESAQKDGGRQDHPWKVVVFCGEEQVAADRCSSEKSALRRGNSLLKSHRRKARRGR